MPRVVIGAAGRALAAFAAIYLHSSAIAQVRTEDECLRINPAITSPVEYVRCTFDSENAERAMLSAYAELRSRVSEERRVLLDKAQSAWVANRDAQCVYEAGGVPDSTGWTSSIIACVAEANNARSQNLQDDMKRR